MRNNVVRFLLAVILLVAAGLRLYGLGQVPPSPDWDEAALGYNAYSILKTGMDEYGYRFPLSIRSFDDYKPPLYVYLTVPSVAVFGLNVWAVRFPSVVMGLLAVLGTYFLVGELIVIAGNTTGKKQGPGPLPTVFTWGLPLLAAALLAISPWHIQFSRIAFEANTGVTLNIWAFWAFLRGLTHRRYLMLSAALMGLGLYAYHTERIFLPLMALLLTTVFRKRLFADGKSVAAALVVGVLVVAPLVPVIFSKSSVSRLQGTSSFADQTKLLARTITKLEDDMARGDKLGQILDNRRLVFIKTFAYGYLSHFSLKWLFLTGDIQRHHAPDMGIMYLWELPFFLLGLVLVFRKGGKAGAFMLGWYVLAPVAASPTTGVPHAVRTLVFLPVMQMFTAVGLLSSFVWLWQWGGRSRVQQAASYGIFAIFAAAVVFNFAYYLDMYFVHMNREVSQYWQYGYEQVVRYTEAQKGKYTKVVVSLKLEQPYMFFLFYTKFDPALYLKGGGTASGGFEEIKNRFDKYEFRKIDWPKEVKDGSILYVGTPEDIPHRFGSQFTYLDGTPAIEVADRE